MEIQEAMEFSCGKDRQNDLVNEAAFPEEEGHCSVLRLSQDFVDGLHRLKIHVIRIQIK
jgi:hypothetical protein